MHILGNNIVNRILESLTSQVARRKPRYMPASQALSETAINIICIGNCLFLFCLSSGIFFSPYVCDITFRRSNDNKSVIEAYIRDKYSNLKFVDAHQSPCQSSDKDVLNMV